MSAAAPQSTNDLALKQDFDSVKSILVELNDIYQQQSEIRETLEAKGVPAVTLNMLANLQRSESSAEFEELCLTAVKVAAEKYGNSAAQLHELEQGIPKLNELDEDALFVRRIAKGMGFNAQAISMLSNVIRQNPGDEGRQVLSDIVEYSAEYGIKLEGLRLIEGGAPEPTSVLPQIEMPEENQQSLLRYKTVLFEFGVAVLLTYTALSLLT